MSADVPDDFSGLWLPLITPFADSAVDAEALKRLVSHYNQTSLKGYVACGSTGEAAALEDEEKLAVMQTILTAAAGRPVIMGVAGDNLRHVLRWVAQLNTYPLAGLLVPAPSYIRPSQAGLCQWFKAIADTSRAPLVIYDIPARTGSRIELETFRSLYAHPRIQAVKDCSGDPVKTEALIEDRRLAVLTGEDTQIFQTVARGGAGAIAAAAHLQTQAFADTVAYLRSGRLAQARSSWAPLPHAVAAMYAQPNPASIKAALAREGWIRNELRPPMATA
ncbi:MAG: 4-hydroxy-tetrahydrodipicolinate synthase [Pseudomonadota bacterium]|jgi:4-hydroxy-tetrahydrodipicolinate synthase